MKTTILLLAALSLTGCFPVYYAPNTQNVPVMKEKGQINISGGITVTEFTEGLELQGAYGLTDKLALQLNTYWINSREDMEYNSTGKGSFIEVGGGYYKKIGKSFVFETYGLAGFGKLKYEEYSDTGNEYGYIQANLMRFGVQPSISFSSKYFIASLSTRFANVNYHNIEGNYPFYGTDHEYESDYLNAHNSQWVAEPALTLQAGFENVKLQLQYTLSYNLGDQYFYENYQEWDMLSLGLKVQIPPKKKSIAAEEIPSEQNKNP